jgi:starvation-inducible DNA-binding protein
MISGQMGKILNKKDTCYRDLVQSLRDSTYVYHQTTIVHWNLMGGKFYSIHKLTQTIYEEMQEGIDTIAEHLRSLDISAPRSVEDLTYSSFPKLTEDCFAQDKLIEQLALNHDKLGTNFEALAAAAEKIGDQLTLDLAVERGRAHKKFQWLLKSTLDYKS